MRIPTVTEPGFEADDMIGYLAGLRREGRVRRLHDDARTRTIAQLVTEKVRNVPARAARAIQPQVWGPAEVCERFGLDRPDAGHRLC